MCMMYEYTLYSKQEKMLLLFYASTWQSSCDHTKTCSPAVMLLHHHRRHHHHHHVVFLMTGP